MPSVAVGFIGDTSTRLREAVRRHSLGHLVTSSTLLLLCTIGVLIILLALLILFHHNLNATKGYQLRSLEYARTQLVLQEELLNTEVARAQSLAVLEADAQVRSMIKPHRPQYFDEKTAVAFENP